VNNREVKVFRLAREGKSNQEIADVLGYEVRTIEQTKWQINLRIAEVSFNSEQR
jgi:DNA-binding NarL/FixJ family response regulator